MRTVFGRATIFIMLFLFVCVRLGSAGEVVQAEPIDFVLPVCVPDRLLWAAVEGYVLENERGHVLE